MRASTERAVIVAILSCLVGLACAAPASAKTSTKTECAIAELVELFGSETTPAELTAPLEEGIVTKFAVLRRASVPGDLAPALSPLSGELDSELSGYYAAEVRGLRVLPNGTRFYLVPGLVKPLQIPPARCLPAAERHKRAHLVEEQSKRALQPVYCIGQVGGRETESSSDCVAFDEIEHSSRPFVAGLNEEPTAELVPDGVASVRISYPSAPAILAAVSENAYVFAPPTALVSEAKRVLKKIVQGLTGKSPRTTAQRKREARRLERQLEAVLVKVEPTKVEWLDAAGGLVRSTPRPSGGLGGLIGGDTASSIPL